MKKISKLIAIMLMLMMVMSCAYDNKIEIDGKPTVVPYYGLGTIDTEKRDDVIYQVSLRNVILSIIFIETIFVPIAVIGWNVMEPVRQK